MWICAENLISDDKKFLIHMSYYDYEVVKDIVEDRGCKLDMKEYDFNLTYTTVKSNIRIESSCGCKTIVQFNNFLYSNTGVICKKCHYKKSEESTYEDYSMQEYKVIKGLSNYCDEFDFKISPDGCLADFAIKPTGCENDKWLPVQMKTTMKSSHGIYSFRVKEEYEDMCIICFAIEDQRVWILSYDDVNIGRISIGENSSIYDQYEIGTVELSSTLMYLYDNSTTHELKYIMNLLPEQMKQEQEFREFRENKFTGLSFDYPEIDARVYDVIINKRYKVQDKVITKYLRTEKTTTYTVHLSKTQSRYCYGDNDYYWLFLPDKKGAYILPEKCLLDAKIISQKNERINSKLTPILHPYKTDVSDVKYGWMNKHLYFFDKPEDMNKIYSLFDDIDKPEIPTETNYFEIISKYRFNGLDKKHIHDLVVVIFKNIITQLKEEKPKRLKILNCNMCNLKLGEDNKTGYCEQCYPKMVVQTGITRKVTRPPCEQLMEELRVSNFTQVGKKYGVSDNAIRKWIKTYEKYKE